MTFVYPFLTFLSYGWKNVAFYNCQPKGDCWTKSLFIYLFDFIIYRNTIKCKRLLFQSQSDLLVLHNVARILELSVPLMEHPSEMFTAQLEEDMMKLILKHGQMVRNNCVSSNNILIIWQMQKLKPFATNLGRPMTSVTPVPCFQRFHMAIYIFRCCKVVWVVWVLWWTM